MIFPYLKNELILRCKRTNSSLILVLVIEHSGSDSSTTIAYKTSNTGKGLECT